MEPDKNLTNEADIGSGEKSQGQKDTDKMIEQVGKEKQQPGQQSGKQTDQKPPVAPLPDNASGSAQPASGQS